MAYCQIGVTVGSRKGMDIIIRAEFSTCRRGRGSGMSEDAVKALSPENRSTDAATHRRHNDNEDNTP